jgi:tRNASer (uridine44-2'-O)-methyltransferase
VFEDLGIAAFLIELWAEMYKDTTFPGFVDIGCGNGLLVHILVEEGYSGWGFDARRRKSWSIWSTKAQDNLKELVLIPSIIRKRKALSATTRNKTQPTSPILEYSEIEYTSTETQPMNPVLGHSKNEQKPQKCEQTSTEEIQEVGVHDGVFPKGTFIISNHADELTPWTPILANISECPFMMIPCCSHALSGDRFRAPPPKDAGASSSAYASLVAWVSKLATECGWTVEKEMLRIPSTRNTALIGRYRDIPFAEIDVLDLLDANGGAVCWEENALKLVKSAVRGH